jgi:hypothetical protein
VVSDGMLWRRGFFGVMMHDLMPNNPIMSVGVASIWGGLMMITAAIGIAGIAFLSYLTVPFWIILAGISFAAGVMVGGGWEKVLAVPASPISALGNRGCPGRRPLHCGFYDNTRCRKVCQEPRRRGLSLVCSSHNNRGLLPRRCRSPNTRYGWC